jgi:hypothetical protein
MLNARRELKTHFLVTCREIVSGLQREALQCRHDRHSFRRENPYAAIAQLVRALDCGSRGPPFEPGRRYHAEGLIFGPPEQPPSVRPRPMPLVVLTSPMSDRPDDPSSPPKSITETLAELVARRKAAQAQAASDGPRGGRRATERAAAATSASKSKPALRK